MALKIDHRFWHDQKERTINFEYRTHLNGQTYVVRECIHSFDQRASGLPIEVVWRRMRHDLMKHLELELFKE